MRQLLGIDDEVKHYVGDLSRIPQATGAPFDVVISFGVIHHLNDIVGFLSALRNVCKHSLLIETLTLPDDLVNEDIYRAIEPKDLAYRATDARVSQIGVKLESGYYPGSTANSGVVFVPARQALMWMIQSCGFQVNSVKNGWDSEIRQDSRAHRRYASATIIAAHPVENSALDFSRQIEASEFDACFIPIPHETLQQIEYVVECFPIPLNPELFNALSRIAEQSDPPVSEMIKAIVHAPRTKTRFERAKACSIEGRENQARDELLALVSELSDDWRSVYRSFALLSFVDSDRRDYWIARLAEANPEFPTSILPGEARA